MHYGAMEKTMIGIWRRQARPALIAAGAMILALHSGGAAVLQSGDLYRLRAVADVALSPDGKRVAYVVERNEKEGRPVRQITILDLAAKSSVTVGEGRSSDPRWSPDGSWLSFAGRVDGKNGLAVVRSDGSGAKFLFATEGTNGPIPNRGAAAAWSPDGKQIVFVSSTPGPESAEAAGDPVVIRRYLYRPELGEGNTRFNDNRRLHLFVVDVASGAVRQLTDGTHSEHSPDWSPDGREILFVSNREENEDQFFNYDVFALRAADRSIRRITSTESAEYVPRWSPDGKKIVMLATRRGLTDLETTMEDTHVWTMNADGSERREIGAAIDQRQLNPSWSGDGKSILFTMLERGNVRLMRIPSAGGAAERIVSVPGRVGEYSTSSDGTVAYTLTTPKDPGQLYIGTQPVTSLNDEVLKDVSLGETESFRFVSNDNRHEVEAFLTKPVGMTAGSKHPLIVVIHGGPHGQQGPQFTFRHQVYAGPGYAVLMVNFRGSVGYGQAFADAVFGDQNGNEAQDVLYGVSAALRRYLWIDRDRLGVEGVSYGGQLSAWLITQTRMFKAAIPIAAITNLISYNYTTYYNQYEQMEFGIFPHQGTLMDTLWQRSALRYVAQAATPTMLVHGENDNDVPITEAEQFYVALKDVGVETVMVRYPREGHGLREPKHNVDLIERSMAWYDGHFGKAETR
jgi:dipeptidyl aminopeptidase/acylaminoacyl peptidase